MRRAELVGALLLGLFSIYLMYKSGQPPGWDQTAQRFDNIGLVPGRGPGSGFWPFWLSAIMLACCGWIIFNWARRTSAPSRSEEPFLDAYAMRMLLTVGGGLIGFVAALQILGFYAGIFLFLIYYIRFLGRHSWLQTMAVAITLPVICFFFFDVAMRIILPKGLTEPLFLPIYELVF